MKKGVAFHQMKTKDSIGKFLLFIFIFSWIFVSVTVFTNYFPHQGMDEQLRLGPHSDWLGRECGVDPEVQDLPYVMMFDINQCPDVKAIIQDTCHTPKVCVDSCPRASISFLPDAAHHYSSSIVCKTQEMKKMAENSYRTFKNLLRHEQCAPYVLRSQPFFSICLPVEFEEVTSSQVVSSRLPRNGRMLRAQAASYVTYEDRLQHSFGLFRLWLCTLFIGTVVIVAVIYVFIQTYLRTAIWWALIYIYVFFMILVIISLFNMIYNKLQVRRMDQLREELLDKFILSFLSTWWAWVLPFVVSAVFLLVYTMFLTRYSYRIKHAIDILQQALRAIGSIRYALLLPIALFLFDSLLVFYIGYLIRLIFSAMPGIRVIEGLSRDKDCICEFEFKEGDECTEEDFLALCNNLDGTRCLKAGCYLIGRSVNIPAILLIVLILFLFLWTLWFVKGFMEMVIGSAFVKWYIAKFNHNIPFGIIKRNFFECLRFHMGTLMFGSFLMVFTGWLHIFLQMVAVLFLYNTDLEEGNLAGRFLKKLAIYTTHVTYVLSFICNEKYTDAAKRVYDLLSDKPRDIDLIHMIAEMLMQTCKLFIVTVLFLLCAAMYQKPQLFIPENTSSEEYNMSFPIVMLISSLVWSYFVASLFFNLFILAVNSIFICFVIDSYPDTYRVGRYLTTRGLSLNIRNVPPTRKVKMQGMSFSSLRKHTALIPLFVCVALGCVGSVFYIGRLAFRNPEVSWNKRGDQEPWNEYTKKQYKFYSPNLDYKTMEPPAPKY